MDGVWRSQGYGNVFETHGPTLNAFEVTNTTCVAGGTAAVDTTPVPGRMATFRTPGGSEMFVRAGGSADHKRLHSEGSASDERIDRIPRLPAVCDHPTENTPAGNFEVFAQTWAEHYKHPLRTFCNDQIQYGHIDEATGYLRILSFSNYVTKGGFAAGLAALEAALDDIFSDRALGALVIDVRINSGGADPYGLAIASRLATSEYLAYTKEARTDPIDRNKWTPGDPSLVRPSARPGFRGPAVELIGPLTISAGETFTQALMGRTPPIHPDRREHAGRLLRRPEPAASERVALRPAEQGVPDAAGDNVRRAGHPAGRGCSGVRG
jgi:hypothetical protein